MARHRLPTDPDDCGWLMTRPMFSVSEVAELMEISPKELLRRLGEDGPSLSPPSRSHDWLPAKPLFTTREVGELVGRSPQSVVNWIHRGRLRATRDGNRYVIPRVELIRLAEEAVA